jgi:hypothetical protein
MDDMKGNSRAAKQDGIWFLYGEKGATAGFTAPNHINRGGDILNGKNYSA